MLASEWEAGMLATEWEGEMLASEWEGEMLASEWEMFASGRMVLWTTVNVLDLAVG